MTPVITKEMKEQIETLLKHGSRVEERQPLIVPFSFGEIWNG